MRKHQQDRGGEGVDLHAEAQAQRCMPTRATAPEATPRSPKRRRQNQTTGPSMERTGPYTHDIPPPPPPSTETLPTCTEAPRVEPASTHTGTGPTAAHATSGSTQRSFAETRGARNRLQRRGKHGFFVEQFPDPTAGEPITAERMTPVDLKAYIRSSGVMANPKNLETAEVLMTTGLTDSGKDRHRLEQYRGNTPWSNVDALLGDMDKLPHGQYLLVRPVIEVIREMVANPAFKGRMKWKPERHYTSRDKKNQVYSNMWTTKRFSGEVEDEERACNGPAVDRCVRPNNAVGDERRAESLPRRSTDSKTYRTTTRGGG